MPATDPGPPTAPRRVRVTNIYATPWHVDSTTGSELPDFLRLWRFERYYRLSADQLPRVLHRERVNASALGFHRWQFAEQVTSATIWLFRLPSGQIVAAVSVDARCDLTDVVDLLEDCYFGDVLIEGRKIEEHARTLAAQLGADGSTEPGLLPERHQIVFDQAPYPTTTRICRSGWSTGPISPTARTTARSATPPSSTAAPAGWQRSART